jgi:hypothetical protein
MTTDEQGARVLRAELDEVARSAPAVGFGAADVIRAGRRRRRLRRGAITGAAAVGLAAVVTVPVVTLRDGSGGGSTAAGPATTPAPTPSPTRPQASPSAAAGPAVPGLTPAQADRIARECALSFGGDDGRAYPPGTNPSDAPSASPSRWAPVAVTPSAPQPTASPGTDPPTASPTTDPPTASSTDPADPTGPAVTPGSTVPPGQRLQDVVHVHNYVRDAAGAHALVYGPNDYLSCDADSSTARYDAGGASGLDTRWLPGPIAVDGWSGTPGGPRSSSDPSIGPAYELVEGRVTAEVTRVVVTAGGVRRQVPAVNGTYVVRIVHAAGWQPSADRPVITAYAADGHKVGSVTGFPRGCWVSPDGHVVNGQAGPDCRPALRWR